ncbi:MAG: hypothetical protein IKE01_01345 [Clostridia bacterium]|nr:hypothetical protein [Clostridia bacterium]
MFNNYNLSDDEVMEIIFSNKKLIDKYSRLSSKAPIDEDLRAEIIEKIYRTLTRNRER